MELLHFEAFCDCDFWKQIGADMEMLMELFGGGRGGMEA
jgi:hypothetical protein